MVSNLQCYAAAPPTSLAHPALLQGNVQGAAAGRRRSDAATPEETLPVGSPPTSPGSPLTYSPQVPMEPIPQSGGPLGRDQAAEFHGVSGWPAQPKLVPTVIICAALAGV